MRALLLCGLLFGCTTSPVAVLPEAPTVTSIFLVPQGGHTGIAVRRSDIPAPLLPEKRDFSGADYLEIGWGERDFYMAQTAGPWLSFKAAFFPNRSVLHVAGLRGELAAFFRESDIVEVRLSQPALEGLLRYLHDAFARDGETPATPLGPGHYGDSRFYPARETFHLLRTCNVWSAAALRAAGLPVRNAITLGGLMSQVQALRAR